MTHYYTLAINQHRDELAGYLIVDDVIYLKSESPIEIMPDETRHLIHGDSLTEPVLNEITQERYEARPARIKQIKDGFSKMQEAQK